MMGEAELQAKQYQRDKDAEHRVQVMDITRRLEAGECVTPEEYVKVAALQANDFLKDAVAPAVDADTTASVKLLTISAKLLGRAAAQQVTAFRKHQESEQRIADLEQRIAALEARTSKGNR